MPWIDKVEARMKEAEKRCLRVIQVQAREAQLSAKAKSIGKSDQGSGRIFCFLRSGVGELGALSVKLPLVSIG
jgi:hypothetical protein